MEDGVLSRYLPAKCVGHGEFPAVRPSFNNHGDTNWNVGQFSVAPNVCTALLGLVGAKDETENGGAMSWTRLHIILFPNIHLCLWSIDV